MSDPIHISKILHTLRNKLARQQAAALETEEHIKLLEQQQEDMKKGAK